MKEMTPQQSLSPNDISDTAALFAENAKTIVKQRSVMTRYNDRVRLFDLKTMLQKSPLGRQILNWAEEHNVGIYFDHQCDKAIGYYAHGSNAVCLNAKYKNHELVSTLAHELRHCWQDHQGFLQHTTTTSPQEHAFKTRLTEADAFAFGYMVSFEARLNIGSTMTPYLCNREEVYHSILEHYHKKDRDSFTDGRAYLQAFDIFFKTTMPRIKYDDHAVKSNADKHGIIRYSIPNVTGELVGLVPYTSYYQEWNINDEKDIRRLGDVFGRYNYLDHIKIGYLVHNPKYRGHFSKNLRNLFKQVRHHKKQSRLHKKQWNTPCKKYNKVDHVKP